MNEVRACVKDAPDGCSVSVKVHPGARRNAVTGTHGGAVKVSLTAPPTDGRANEALIALFAGVLGVPKAKIVLHAGAASRIKQLRIQGASADEVVSMLMSSIV